MPDYFGKSITGDFPGIGRLRLDFADGVVAEVLDQVWINSTDKDTGIVEGMEDGFMIATGAFHDHPGLSVKVQDKPGKVVQGTGRVYNIERLFNDSTARLQD